MRHRNQTGMSVEAFEAQAMMLGGLKDAWTPGRESRDKFGALKKSYPRIRFADKPGKAASHNNEHLIMVFDYVNPDRRDGFIEVILTAHYAVHLPVTTLNYMGYRLTTLGKAPADNEDEEDREEHWLVYLPTLDDVIPHYLWLCEFIKNPIIDREIEEHGEDTDGEADVEQAVPAADGGVAEGRE